VKNKIYHRQSLNIVLMMVIRAIVMIAIHVLAIAVLVDSLVPQAGLRRSPDI
jgi:hypothetical protein